MPSALRLHRIPSLGSSLCAYAAASIVASLVAMLAVCAISFLPGRIPLRLELLPQLLAITATLAAVIGVVAAVPTMMTVWLLRRVGMMSRKMFAIAGGSIGVAAVLVFTLGQGVADRVSAWLSVKPPSDEVLLSLLMAGSGVAALAGGLAGLTYWLVAGYGRVTSR